MKKVMFFLRAFPSGGAEKLMLDIIKRLDKDKFDVYVYSRGNYGEYADEFNKYVKCRTCFSHLKPGRNILRKLYNYLVINISDRLINIFPGFYYRNAIKEKFDIEIAFKNDESTKIIASSTNKNSKKIQWIHTDFIKHNGWLLYFKNQKEREKYLKKYDKIICVSEFVENSLKKVLPKINNTEVVYNLISTDDIIKKSEINVTIPQINENIPIMISVGRMEFEKRFDLLIKIHKRLIDENIRHYLILVGGGRKLKDLKELAKSYNVSDTVIFTGYTPNPYPYIKKSDFSVCTSLYEGFHLASAESLVLGKPVVSCCPVVGELIGNTKSGVLCEYSENDLYEAIKKVLLDKKLLYEMQFASRNRLDFFDEKRIIEKIESILKKI